MSDPNPKVITQGPTTGPVPDYDKENNVKDQLLSRDSFAKRRPKYSQKYSKGKSYI